MHKYISELGPREAEFLSIMASSNSGQFNVGRAANFWGTEELAWKKLRLLEKKGWIARIERGKYLVIPLEAGTNRAWSEEPYVIASALVQPAVIAYWSAVRHWNWTEQIPRVIYVQTTRRKNETGRIVFGVQYQYVTVTQKKFFGYIKEWRKGREVLITDMEKTLLDCSDDVDRAGGIEELIKAVKAGAREISWSKLDQYAFRFPNRSALKRLGFLLELYTYPLPDGAAEILSSWKSRLSAGVVPLQPGGGRGGKINSKWRLRANVEIR